MSTEKRAESKLYPKCPASSAGARCRNQKRSPQLGLVCQPAGQPAVLPLAGVQRCPWPGLADLQATELVCPKHGRGVEALTIAGTALSGQFCLACSLELLGGMLPQVAEQPVPLKAPELSVLEEATEDDGGFFGEDAQPATEETSERPPTTEADVTCSEPEQPTDG